MMFLLVTGGCILTFMYALTLVKLRIGIRRLRQGGNRVRHSVTVIIAARNEEQHIGNCLAALTRQNWPASFLEVLIADDRSDDRTAQIVRRFAEEFSFVRLIRIKQCPPNLSPKKHALMTAIRQASGDIIATTDADCTPGPGWITAMIAHFEANVGMVVGFTPYTAARQNLLSGMLQLDYFSLACVSAASIGLGFPVSACGGNLMYRRLVYDQVGGFGASSGVVSGDDDLFLEKVRENTNWRIAYAADQVSHVPTRPPGSWSEFLNQRIRYASKGTLYATPVVAILLAVFTMNVLLSLGWLLPLFSLKLTYIWLFCLCIKSAAEFLFLKCGSERFGVRFGWATFLLTAILHPLYISLAGLLGQIADFEWKKQRHPANRMVQKRYKAV